MNVAFYTFNSNPDIFASPIPDFINGGSYECPDIDYSLITDPFAIPKCGFWTPAVTAYGSDGPE